jgi:lysophospholipase L1-like esterase
VGKLRIFVITDSLGLPRNEPEFVALEHTWPQLFREELPGVCVYQLSLGGATTDDVLPQLDFLNGQEPALVVVQAGIVDCAPRAFRKQEIALLLATRAGRALLNGIEARTFGFLRRLRNISYLSPRRFEQNVQRIRSRFSCPLVWVSIIGGPAYDERVPGVTARIGEYNALIRRNLGEQFLDLDRWLSAGHIMADGHHLNEHGHRALISALMEHPSVLACRSSTATGRTG